MRLTELTFLRPLPDYREYCEADCGFAIGRQTSRASSALSRRVDGKRVSFQSLILESALDTMSSAINNTFMVNLFSKQCQILCDKTTKFLTLFTRCSFYTTPMNFSTFQWGLTGLRSPFYKTRSGSYVPRWFLPTIS